jgi:hypothetical protein
VPKTAPQSVADAFMKDLLAGLPDDASERVSPTRGQISFDLPELSVELQESHYRIARTKRRGANGFAYLLVGRSNGRRVSRIWIVALVRDPDAWRVAGLRRADRFT